MTRQLWHGRLRFACEAADGWRDQKKISDVPFSFSFPTDPGGELRAMAKQSLVREFFLFIKHEKKWWLVPLILVLLIVGALVIFASSSPLAPFLYPLF